MRGYKDRLLSIFERDLATCRAERNALMEAIDKATDSITCLCAEGPEFHKPHTIYEAVIKEAMKLRALIDQSDKSEL